MLDNYLRFFSVSVTFFYSLLDKIFYFLSSPVAIMDATLSSGTSKCGPQVITGQQSHIHRLLILRKIVFIRLKGWTENYDYYTVDGTSSTSTAFDTSTGVYTPPVAGYYKED